jgi:hypothetical protein
MNPSPSPTGYLAGSARSVRPIRMKKAPGSNSDMPARERMYIQMKSDRLTS